MRFSWSRAGAAIAALLMLSGCGLMGDKTDANRFLEFKDTMGCMNDLGPNVQAFYEGRIDAARWSSTWDCGTQSLAKFKKFVRPGSAEGYTRADFLGLANLMVTDQLVTPELIGVLFDLKASLFGGTRDVITVAEIDKVVDLIGVARTETLKLLPYMAMRANQATPDNMLLFADALASAGDGLSAAFKTSGNPTFSFSSAQQLADELGKMLKFSVAPEVVAWLSVVKVVMTAGATDGIAPGDWPRIIKTVVSYGGPVLAVFSVDTRYLVGPNAYGRFGMQLGSKLKSSLMQTLALYGGALPLKAIDSVIDALPASWLTYDRKAIKDGLRPIANRLLEMKSRRPDTIDMAAIDMIFDKLNTWSTSQTHLETIFEQLRSEGYDSSVGVSIEVFSSRADKYARSLAKERRGPAFELISLAEQTPRLFQGTDFQMTFNGSLTHTLHNLTTFNWIQMVAKHLMRVYSTLPGKMLAQNSDLQALVDEFKDLVMALKLSDVTITGWANNRFMEANLFTYKSDGDKAISIDETTQLIAMALSGGVFSSRFRPGINAACPPMEDPHKKGSYADPIGVPWVSPSCFRREFFTHYRTYWNHAPHLIHAYERMSDNGKVDVQNAMEKVARRYGITNEPLGSFDQSGYAGIIQYMEVLLSKYDRNDTQMLSMAEAMEAYPMFRPHMIEAAKPQLDTAPEWLIKDAFTYMLKYGHKPTELQLVGWVITPNKVLGVDRRILYSVIAEIANPPPPPTAASLPPEPYELNAQEVLNQVARALSIPVGSLPSESAALPGGLGAVTVVEQ